MRAIRRLILWDIDGTLLSAGAAARDVFDQAVTAAVGRDPGGHGVSMSGKTDPQIALEILASMALSESDARRHLPAVLQDLERRLEHAVHLIRANGLVHPGVKEVLARLDADPEALQSVLTGNLAANARLKLGAFGLDRWLHLDVAATGSDDHERTNLVPVALDKVEARYGRRLDPADVWVVGDTPLDLACARAGGARCLLVATGRARFDELSGLGADAALPDLTDVDRAVEILTGLGRAEVGSRR
jgi:phosphoglycolate phosphatase